MRRARRAVVEVEVVVLDWKAREVGAAVVEVVVWRRFCSTRSIILGLAVEVDLRVVGWGDSKSESGSGSESEEEEEEALVSERKESVDFSFWRFARSLARPWSGLRSGWGCASFSAGAAGASAMSTS